MDFPACQLDCFNPTNEWKNSLQLLPFSRRDPRHIQKKTKQKIKSKIYTTPLHIRSWILEILTPIIYMNTSFFVSDSFLHFFSINKMSLLGRSTVFVKRNPIYEWIRSCVFPFIFILFHWRKLFIFECCDKTNGRGNWRKSEKEKKKHRLNLLNVKIFILFNFF